MADQEIIVDIKAQADELKEQFNELKEGFDKAKEAAKMFSEIVHGDVSNSLKQVGTDAAAVGTAVEAAFNPLAVVALLQTVAEATEKLTQFISDTFIYTEAQKKADEQLKSQNKTLMDLAEKTKAVKRERELLNATSASERDKIKLKFQIEDDGGTAAQLKQKLKDVNAEIQKLIPQSFQTEMVDVYTAEGQLVGQTAQLTDAAQKAKARIAELSGGLAEMQAKSKLADEQEKLGNEQIARDKAQEAERARAEQERRRREAQAAFERAQQQQMKSFREALQQKKDALDAFHEMSKEDEVKYWDEVLAKNKIVGENLKQVLHMRAEAQKEAQRKGLHDEIENVEEQLAHYKAGSRERVTILQAELAKLEAEGKADTEEYKRLVKQKIKAVDELEKAEEEAAKKRNQLQHDIQKVELSEFQEHVKAERDLRTQQADFDLQVGRITAQRRHAIARQALDQEHKDQVAAVNQEMLLLEQAGKKETTEYANLHKQLAKIEDDYRKNSAKLTQQWILQQRQHYQQYFNQFNSMFNSALNGWIEGTESMSQAFSKMFQSILKSLIQFVEDWIEKKIEMWIMDQLISDTSRNAAATAEIASNAAVAASGAYAATAQIPITGPEMAPFAAMQAYFDVMGMQSLAHFAQGGIVPSTGLAVVHGGEMVLPAGLSQGMSRLVQRGTGDGRAVHVHVYHNVNAIDSASFKDTIKRHGHMIGDEVARVLKKKGFAAG